MNLRLYQSTDQIACLAIMQANTPRYFASHELDEFRQFLTHLADP